mgnify:CR=1 FL=1
MNRQLLTLIILLLAALLAGCTVAPMQPSGAMGDMTAMATEAPLPEPEPGKLTIVDVRARPAPLAGGTGAVYFTVLNGLDSDVQLVSASSPAANVVETHETVAENGVMKMIPLPEGYTVPAGEALMLKPGGKHIMLIDIVKPLAPGDTVDLTVNFDNGESMELTVPVLDMQMTMPGNMQMPDTSHDHHDHGEDSDAKSEEHSHDHGESSMEHSHDVMDSALANAIKALPISAVHNIDETLHDGKELDGTEAIATLDALLEQVNTFTWPAELETAIAEIKLSAEALRSAIENGDLDAAGPLATKLHDLLHELEMH